MACEAPNVAWKDFYVFLQSDDNINYYPGNKFDNFRCLLPKHYFLKNTENAIWCLALTDICLLNTNSGLTNPLPTSCVILSDLVENSVIRGGLHPVLRQLWSTKKNKIFTLSNLIYRPIQKFEFCEITIKILDHRLRELNHAQWQTLQDDVTVDLQISLVLHFQLQAIMGY